MTEKTADQLVADEHLGPLETHGAHLIAHIRRTAEGRVPGIHEFIAPTERLIDAGGIKINVLDWGNEGALPVVFFHAGRLNAHSWDVVCSALREDFHCYAFDLPGHGDSGWYEDGWYPFEKNAGVMMNAIEQLGIGRFILVGLSFGAFTALSLATAHAERLYGLVSMDVAPTMAIEGVEKQLATMRVLDAKPFPEFVRAAMGGRVVRDVDRLRFTLSQNMRQLPDGFWTWKYDTRPRTQPAARLMKEHHDINVKLHQITCPTLVLRGERSDLVTPEAAVEMMTALPNAHFEEIEKARHILHHDNPLAVIQSLRRFFATLPLPPGNSAS